MNLKKIDYQMDPFRLHIGSIFPISSLLIRIALIPIVPEKMRRRKSFGHLSSPSRKTRLGSIHSEKMEF